MTSFTHFEFGIIVEVSENLLSAFGYAKPREKPTHSEASSSSHSKTTPMQVDSQPLLQLGSHVGWLVAQHSATESSCGADGAPRLHAEGLRRDFSCSASSREAETIPDKAQGSEYLTRPASQTRFCLGALEFTLTRPFYTTSSAGMGVDSGGTAHLILPMYNQSFTIPSEGQCLESEPKHIYNTNKVKVCHNKANR